MPASGIARVAALAVVLAGCGFHPTAVDGVPLADGSDTSVTTSGIPGLTVDSVEVCGSNAS